MVDKYRWRKTLGDGVVIEVACRSQGELESPSDDQSKSQFSILVENASTDEFCLKTPNDDGITVDRVSDSSCLEFHVSIPIGSGLIRTYVQSNGQRDPIYLPGPDLVANCVDAINGDTDAARAILKEFAAPTQVPALCGEFLPISEVGGLIETLAEVNSYTASFLHSYRYDLIRGAIVSDHGLSVQSTDELEALVERLDSVQNIGQVGLVDAISDTVAAMPTSGEETKAMLDSQGFDLDAVERSNDDLFFAVYLAQLVLTDGVRAAEGHTMERRWHLDGNYKRRKTQAKNAEYQDRGQVWRELLCLAARQSLDEFAYVLANALYWSGENTHTHSRMDELLFKAAARVASEIGLIQIEARARYEEYLSRGHRLRSQKCYSLARAAFDRAGDVAAEHDFLPAWEPVYTKATVHSAEYGSAGEHAQAVTILDDALERLFDYDIAPAKLNHIVHHLEGQKLESKARLADFQSDTDDPVSLLQEASTHYDVIGLDRSRERTQRKLEQAKRSAPSPTPQSPESAEQIEETTSESQDDRSSTSATAANSETKQKSTTSSGKTVDAGKRQKQEPLSAQASRQSKQQNRKTGGHVRSNHAQEEFEPNPELNDFLAPSDPEEVGSADLMTSPDNREDHPHTSADRGWGDENRTGFEDSY
ncbi:hypothetical protein ACERIM_13585 [Natrinema sp. H-ect1]|uniref:hypothetical protein n=1 Tax=Natrinema sp. H-ect1 TaxID=3242700 RepID=UPI00359E4681